MFGDGDESFSPVGFGGGQPSVAAEVSGVEPCGYRRVLSAPVSLHLLADVDAGYSVSAFELAWHERVAFPRSHACGERQFEHERPHLPFVRTVLAGERRLCRVYEFAWVFGVEDGAFVLACFRRAYASHRVCLDEVFAFRVVEHAVEHAEVRVHGPGFPCGQQVVDHVLDVGWFEFGDADAADVRAHGPHPSDFVRVCGRFDVPAVGLHPSFGVSAHGRPLGGADDAGALVLGYLRLEAGSGVGLDLAGDLDDPSSSGSRVRCDLLPEVP